MSIAKNRFELIWFFWTDVLSEWWLFNAKWEFFSYILMRTSYMMMMFVLY